jgi:hypothetical protein
MKPLPSEISFCPFFFLEAVQDLFVLVLSSTILLDFWWCGRMWSDSHQGRLAKKTVKFAEMTSAKRF